MLLVARIELATVNQVADVGHVDNADAIRSEQPFNPADEGIGVPIVSQDVVSVDHFRPSIIAQDSLSHQRRKEFGDDRDSSSLRNCGKVLGRVDPQDLDAVYRVI